MSADDDRSLWMRTSFRPWKLECPPQEELELALTGGSPIHIPSISVSLARKSRRNISFRLVVSFLRMIADDDASEYVE